ncbi:MULTISPECIES: T9SS type A sorting domain-containing protein [Flavobacterium]|uniref:T9SS type A sorting domain-containing protein n=1 Tax=Flavobacterium TaxID=237 RepID=UPI00211593B0|nr:MULTISPECIES: T9SS type A sorting domain-containing protein [Flavobacterium]UUF15742.1 T9SS type A sorting domain-containing protein [Flavobacterium panici]
MKTKLLLLLFLAHFSIYAQTNLVLNGDFENWTEGTLDNWAVANTVTSSSDAAAGQYSAKLSFTTASAKIITQVPMKTGITYIVKFKYKYLSSNYGGDHPISLKISKDGSATSISSSAFASNNSWTEKETTFTPDMNLSYDLSISMFSFDSAVFDILIDDVQVYTDNVSEEYTQIPDTAFENKLIALGIDTDGTNGKVLTTSIASVTDLSMQFSSISDLTGIQDFVNLANLDCSNNNLTSLDLSKNTKLTELNFNNNKVSTIDLSNNSFLKKLNCDDNLLTSLDVSKNTEITWLYCYKNQLTTLDVTKNILLDDLYFANNSITSMDLSKNPLLISLYCQNNALTQLDISQNPKLVILYAPNNQLTNLDISQNTALTNLNVKSNQLTELNLKNGKNTILNSSLNLTLNPNLNCIQVDNIEYSNTNWADKKDATATFSKLCNPPIVLVPDSNFEQKLIDLGIDTDGLNGKILGADIDGITYLDLSNSNITDLTGIEIFTGLTYLDCDNNNLSTVDVSKNVHLTKLALSGNKLTTLDLSSNKDLFNLSFSYNQISTIDLSQNKNLHYLIADNNKLNSVDLSSNPELEIIFADFNNLSELNVSNLKNLYLLSCGFNNLSGLNVVSNTKLEQLYCYNNQITTLDLSNNALLKTLNAAFNQITTLDLSHNPNLTIIYLVVNPLTYLNIQNGNNENFVVPSENGKKAAGVYTSFLQNSKLGCIKVDNAAYANANWSKIKESTTVYSETCTLGLEDSVFNKAAIYPNPTKGELNIKNVSLEKANVYNSLGQLVKSFTLNSADVNHSINLSGLPKGVYYVYLINQDAASAKKVIVE